MAEDPEEDDAFVIPDGEVEIPPDGDIEIPAEWKAKALYTLEAPARCPYCRQSIRTLNVIRLNRTQVTFTSTLPRGGRVLTCPACERIISAELAVI